MVKTIAVKVHRQGIHDITEQISRAVTQLLTNDGLREGLCTLFIQHTSASLLIQENYDPSARVDLESWLDRLVPEHDPLYTHTIEGPDDMPAHIKTMLTATNLSIPIMDGKLALGTWQGIFLWEHRHESHSRNVVLHVGA